MTQRSTSSDDQRRADYERVRLLHLAGERWRASDVPPRHAAVAKLRHTAKGVWAECYAELSQSIADGWIVALVGKRGVGKTQLGACIAAEVILSGFTALYTTAEAMFRRLRESFEGEGESRAIDRLTRKDLLIIDEIHLSPLTDYESRRLIEIIDNRYGRSLATLIIGNVGPDEFEKLVGSSVCSRMVETGKIIDCTRWPEWRSKPSLLVKAERKRQAEGRVALASRLAVPSSDHQSDGGEL